MRRFFQIARNDVIFVHAKSMSQIAIYSCGDLVRALVVPQFQMTE